jgi:phosphoribosylanthranilate isomerase
VILAGGLRPSNVADAIARVRPASVDVHTGVEGADGRKRRDLVLAFVAAARRAFRGG